MRDGRIQVTYSEDADTLDMIEAQRERASRLKRRDIPRSEILRWLTGLGIERAELWHDDAIRRHF
jgi:hypothetical protein